MKIAIISDIHSNLHALQSVFAFIEQSNFDKIICLGDIVGYGPYPNECIDLVRNKCHVVLAGNHDHATVGLTDISYFNSFAKSAIQFTARVITKDNADYLRGLEFEYREPGMFFVHASPNEPPEWHYITNTFAAESAFDAFSEQVCFIGHTHYPVVYMNTDDQNVAIASIFGKILSERKRYLINIGSVGQPRDNDPRAAFGVFDVEKRICELIRTPYDVNATQREMRNCALPEFLVQRLALGR